MKQLDLPLEQRPPLPCPPDESPDPRELDATAADVADALASSRSRANRRVVAVCPLTGITVVDQTRTAEWDAEGAWGWRGFTQSGRISCLDVFERVIGSCVPIHDHLVPLWQAMGAGEIAEVFPEHPWLAHGFGSRLLAVVHGAVWRAVATGTPLPEGMRAPPAVRCLMQHVRGWLAAMRAPRQIVAIPREFRKIPGGIVTAVADLPELRVVAEADREGQFYGIAWMVDVLAAVAPADDVIWRRRQLIAAAVRDGAAGPLQMQHEEGASPAMLIRTLITHYISDLDQAELARLPVTADPAWDPSWEEVLP